MTLKHGDRIYVVPYELFGTVLGVEDQYVNYRQDNYEYTDDYSDDFVGDEGDEYGGLNYHTVDLDECRLIESTKKERKLTGFAKFIKGDQNG